MRKAARVIVVHHQNILVMKRNKFGQEYYCLVGGGIDMGETAEQAALRETYEETSLTVTGPRLTYIEDSGDPYGVQYVFICDYKDGDLQLHPGSIEARLNAEGKNTFTPLWLPVSKLAHIPFRSSALQAEILQGLRDGFPETPKMLTSQAEIRYTTTRQKEE